MVCYVAHRCYCQLVRCFECSYVLICWKYDVCFSQSIAVEAEVIEVCAFTHVKIVWEFSQRVAIAAEAIEVCTRTCVKIVWKFSQGIAVGAEVIESGSRTCVKVVWKFGKRGAV